MEKRKCILFTAVGNSDPVCGYHDAAMLHIIRHCNPYKIYMLLTEKLKIKEEKESLYSKAINYLADKLKRKRFKIVKPEINVNGAVNLDKLANEPDSPTLILLKINVNEADNLDKLDIIRKIFINAFNDPDNEGAEWLFNITSGTPQIQVVMSLLALDYSSKAKAIQVRDHDPDNYYPTCDSWEQAKEQLDENEDDDSDTESRINKPLLLPFNEHGLKSQIISLVEEYEYYGAHELVDNDKNKSLFIGTNIEPLLKYAYLRKNLQSDEANQELDRIKLDGKIIDSEKKEQLRIGTKVEARFSEYFRVMELCQRKQQLSDFVMKLSPILLDIGQYYIHYYLREHTNFHLEKIYEDEKGSKKFTIDPRKKQDNKNIAENNQVDKKLTISRDLMYENYPELFKYIEENQDHIRNDLYFSLVVHICNYYKENGLENDKKHNEVCSYFNDLRDVERYARNKVAHELTNVTDKRFESEKLVIVDSDSNNPDYKIIIDSKRILNLLRETILLIKEICELQGIDIENGIASSYDTLNKLIKDSLNNS